MKKLLKRILVAVCLLTSQLSLAVEYNQKNFKNDCNYLLSNVLNQKILNTSSQTLSKDIQSYIFKLDLSDFTEKLIAELTFVCAKTEANLINDAARKSDKVLSPKELIQLEDAGGRYYRNVAWQKNVSTNSWNATVAYINYQFGDGQKTPMSFYLICHTTRNLPCVELELNLKLSKQRLQVELVSQLINGISFFPN